MAVQEPGVGIAVCRPAAAICGPAYPRVAEPALSSHVQASREQLAPTVTRDSN